MNSVDLPFAIITYREPVVHIVFKEASAIDGPDVQKLLESCKQISRRKPALLFVEFTGYLEVSPEARRVGALPENTDGVYAIAILVNSLAMKLTVNFYQTVNRPNVKLRMFNNREKAMQWLMKLNYERKAAV